MTNMKAEKIWKTVITYVYLDLNQFFYSRWLESVAKRITVMKPIMNFVATSSLHFQKTPQALFCQY